MICISRKHMTRTKGFTLIELLIVIAILAILAAVVVVVLNPGELLRQGRDSQRVADLSAVNSAISLYVTDTVPATWTVANFCTTGTTVPGSAAASCTLSATTTVNGDGWVPINFTLISSGSPLGRLPMDPANGSTACLGTPAICFYAFEASSTVPFGKYKIHANMESVKYATGGTGDVESNTKDGGTENTWYEVGSDLTI